MFIESAVEMLKRRCIHLLTSNVTLYGDDDDATVSDAVELIQRQMCVDRCQPHGHCQYGL